MGDRVGSGYLPVGAGLHLFINAALVSFDYDFSETTGHAIELPSQQPRGATNWLHL